MKEATGHTCSFRTSIDQIEIDRTVARVISAIELTQSQKDELKAKLKQKCNRNVTLECYNDETLLGGLIIEIDGKQIDASLKSRLKDVKEVIKR